MKNEDPTLLGWETIIPGKNSCGVHVDPESQIVLQVAYL